MWVGWRGGGTAAGYEGDADVRGVVGKGAGAAENSFNLANPECAGLVHPEWAGLSNPKWHWQPGERRAHQSRHHLMPMP